MKKYKLTSECVNFDGKYLHRIRALRDFGNVKKGELGGYVESEKNLTHEGTAWVSGYAKVIGDSSITGCAVVTDQAIIRDHARVISYALVWDNADIGENVVVSGHTQVHGSSRLRGHARINDYAEINGNAFIGNFAKVEHEAVVGGDSMVLNYSRIRGHAIVTGSACIIGNSIISGEACIQSDKDYFSVYNVGVLTNQTSTTTTFFRLIDRTIGVYSGEVYESLNEFRKKVVETHGTTKYATEYLMLANLAEKYFKEE